MLRLEKATMKFGGLTAVDQLSFAVSKGELVGLIGPNGAGKTTAFNLITGFYKPTSGSVSFQKENLVKKSVHEIAQMGLVRTFQNIRLFKELSVLENVLIGSTKLIPYSWGQAIARTSFFFQEELRLRKNAEHWLQVFGLLKWKDTSAKNLPYGDQRKLEIVRALVSEPHMICMDEPAAGMNHTETDELMLLIQRLRREFGMTILLIEHDMKLVMNICERILVLDHGVLIAEGRPQEIQKSPKVIEAYLGAEAPLL